jgi:hypothetical protein
MKSTVFADNRTVRLRFKFQFWKIEFLVSRSCPAFWCPFVLQHQGFGCCYFLLLNFNFWNFFIDRVLFRLNCFVHMFALISIHWLHSCSIETRWCAAGLHRF